MSDTLLSDILEVHAMHERIVADNAETESGRRTPEAVASAVTDVSDGYVGRRPETIHEKAAHLVRLVAADHSSVDGKSARRSPPQRLSTNSTGLPPSRRPPDQGPSSFATDAENSDVDAVVAYLRTRRSKSSDGTELQTTASEECRERAVQFVDDYIDDHRALFDELATE